MSYNLLLSNVVIRKGISNCGAASVVVVEGGGVGRESWNKIIWFNKLS